MPERGSEPARYEDKLRARQAQVPPSLNAVPNIVPLMTEERDALADAVAVLRSGVTSATSEWQVKAEYAIKRLDGLGG